MGGALAPIVLIPFLVRWLPESPVFMIRRNVAPERVYAVFRRIDGTLPPSLPGQTEPVFSVEENDSGQRTAFSSLFTRKWLWGTVLLWLVFMINLAEFYALQSWLPSIMTDLGHPMNVVVAATTLTTVGGIAAAFVTGPSMDRLGPYRTLAVLYLVGFGCLALTGVAFHAPLWVLLTANFFAGCCVSGGQKSLIALAAVFYPAPMRSTGVGWALGVGRVGGILGPILVGAALTLNWSPSAVFYAMAVPMLAAGVTVALLGMRYGPSRQGADRTDPAPDTEAPSLSHGAARPWARGPRSEALRGAPSPGRWRGAATTFVHRPSIHERGHPGGHLRLRQGPAPGSADLRSHADALDGRRPLALYTLTATAPLVTADLGIGGAQLGVLPATAFVLAALVSPFAGRYTDRLSGKVVLAVLFTGAGLALLGVAAAPSYGWLLVAVALSGATQALSNPVTNQLIAAHVSQGQRGGLMGVKQSGVQMSQFGAGLLLPSVALWWGWRGAALAAAVVAVAGLVMVRGAVPAVPPSPSRGTGHRLAALPAGVWWLTGYALASGAAIQATNVYLPLYAFERLEMPVRAAGLTVAVAGGVGLVARIAWGRSADRVRNPYPLLAVLASVSALAVGGLMVADTLDAPALVWAAPRCSARAASPPTW